MSTRYLNLLIAGWLFKVVKMTIDVDDGVDQPGDDVNDAGC